MAQEEVLFLYPQSTMEGAAVPPGALVGWIAGKIMDSEGGLVRNIVVGIIGSFVGSFVFGLVGLSAFGFIGNLIVSVVGACLFIWLGRKLFR